MGVAGAVGVRPFLPALVAGGLAAANVEIHFNSTSFFFLQSAPFLLGMAAGAIVLALIERRRIEAEALTVVLGAISAAIGALWFAGALAHGHYTDWPGLVAGVICAVIGVLATRPLLLRVRARLDPEAAAAVPLYAEAFGVLLAALSVIAPPVGSGRAGVPPVAADCRAQALGTEVRRPSDPALSCPKRGTILS